MKVFKVYISIGVLLFFADMLYGQVDMNRSISIQVRVLEQLKGNIQPLISAPIELKGLGKYETNESGRFAFSVPMKELAEVGYELLVNVLMDDYKVVKPYEGKTSVDIEKNEVALDILVIGQDIEEEYRQKLDELSKKLKQTQRKNALSIKAMNAMNDSLVNALQRDAEQRSVLQSTINDLKEKADSEAAAKESFAKELEKAEYQLQNLHAQLDEKEEELYEALEEQYLRQQNYFQSISSDLSDFVIRAKDVQDLLKNVGNYFKAVQYPNYAAQYNSTLTAYNEIFLKIQENHSDYVHGVQRYWDDPSLSDQLSETFEVVFDQVHHPKLKPAINEVNNYLRKNKAGKASKLGESAYEELNPVLINLEKMVNRMIGKL